MPACSAVARAIVIPPVAAAAERVYGTLPHRDDADQRAIDTGATGHGGRKEEGCAPASCWR